MKETKNWAYGVSIRGVGTIYYARAYFDRDGLVNPLTAAPYTGDELAAIARGAAEGAEGFVFELPEGAVLGMNGFWYDAAGAVAITSHADPLTQGADGAFVTADGATVAGPIAG